MVLGETIEKTVVLAGHIDDRRMIDVGVEDLVHAPTLRPVVRDHARRARGLEPARKRVVTVPVFVPGVGDPLIPGLLCRLPARLHRVIDRRAGPVLPARVGTAGGLRERHHHELPLACGSQATNAALSATSGIATTGA